MWHFDSQSCLSPRAPGCLYLRPRGHGGLPGHARRRSARSFPRAKRRQATRSCSQTSPASVLPRRVACPTTSSLTDGPSPMRRDAGDPAWALVAPAPQQSQRHPRCPRRAGNTRASPRSTTTRPRTTSRTCPPVHPATASAGWERLLASLSPRLAAAHDRPVDIVRRTITIARRWPVTASALHPARAEIPRDGVCAQPKQSEHKRHARPAVFLGERLFGAVVGVHLHPHRTDTERAATLGPADLRRFPPMRGRSTLQRARLAPDLAPEPPARSVSSERCSGLARSPHRSGRRSASPARPPTDHHLKRPPQ